MNAVEIEQAITDLSEQPFDPENFPYAFLETFGEKATTLKRLRAELCLIQEVFVPERPSTGISQHCETDCVRTNSGHVYDVPDPHG